VQVVPLAHGPLLPLDDRDALAGEHEEPLLVGLEVVEARCLARVQDVDADAEQRRARRRRLEHAPDATPGNGRPAQLGEVQDEPAVVDGDAAELGVVDARLVHGALRRPG
jgi:hypothetical protein